MTPGIIDRGIAIHEQRCCLERCCLVDGCNCSEPFSGIHFICCEEESVGDPYDTHACSRPGGCQSEDFTCQHLCCTRRNYDCIYCRNPNDI